MRPEIQFVLSSLGLSAIITYFWWSRHRVWAFREDLFAIRDRTWDAMLAEGLLQSSEHVSFRSEVNSLIRLAPYLSIFTALKLIFELDLTRGAIESHPTLPQLEAPRDEITSRVVRYIMLESLSGWTILAFFGLFGMARPMYKAIINRVQLLFDTDSFVRFDRHVAPIARERTTTAHTS
jgi:hypothetical protein